MTSQLAQELATALTGADCPATAAFIQVALADCWEFRAASAHWEAAGEDLQDAVAAHLGLVEPTGERSPVPAAIARAYDTAMTRASELID